MQDVDGRYRSPQETGIDRKANQGANQGNVLDLTDPFWKGRVAWQKRNGEIRIVFPLPAKKFRLNFLATDNPARQRTLAQEIAALAKEKGCDAVISGNGA